MRLLFVTKQYPPVAWGATDRLCRHICHSLRARGHEVTILTSDQLPQKHLNEPDVSRGLKISDQVGTRTAGRALTWSILADLHRVGKKNRCITKDILKDNPCDLVFGWNLKGMGAGILLAAHDLGLRFCLNLADSEPGLFFRVQRTCLPSKLVQYVAERSAFSQACFPGGESIPIIASSQSLKEYLLKKGCPLERCRVIQQGLPIREYPFEPYLREKKQDLKLLYQTDDPGDRGVFIALDALGRLMREGAGKFCLSLVLGKNRRQQEEVNRFIESEGLLGKVVIENLSTHFFLPHVLKKQHVFISVSEKEEPFGLEHLEAMASGCAVVSDKEGISDLVKHKQTGLSFKPGDPEELREKIKKLMNNEELRLEIIEKARARVLKYHSFASYLDQLESYLTEIAGK